jgi:hypothetical protein
MEQSYIARARAAIGLGITYGLGKGGTNPLAPTPANSANQCDCSGFIAWVIGYSRRPSGNPTGGWISTSHIVADARGRQKLFRQIDAPVPGSIAVYPDANGHQGHTGLVVGVNPLMGIDCAARGVTEHSFSRFASNPTTIWVEVVQ